MAKLKTTMQMLALGYSIVHSNQMNFLGWLIQWFLLGGALYLSLYSAYSYARLVIKKI